jgi:GNAT superfamily N-acetyltransferase
MAYDIVPYAPELAPQIVRLQRHFYGDAARSAAYFHWKYAENPFLDETILQLAVNGGRVVAMRGMFGAVWQVDEPSARHLLPCADDFVVDPEHRNHGVARLVLEAAAAEGVRRNLRFALSLSAGAVTFVNSLATGWRAAGSYRTVRRARPSTGPASWMRRVAPRWLKQSRLRGALDRVRGSSPGASRGPFDHFDCAPRHDGKISLSLSPRPEDMAALIERLPWDGRIRHVRDPAYLAWRFRNPLREYRFVFWNDGGVQGYLVLQRSLSDGADPELVNVVDWEAAEEHVADALLRAALDHGRFPCVQAWSAGIAPTRQHMLDADGFVAAEERGIRARSSGLLVRRLYSADRDERWCLGSRDLLRIDDWDLRMLYSMSA